MKISYNWLKNYIDTDLTVNELSEVLTDIGLEIEGIELYEEIEGSLKGIVVGKVLECNKIEGTDHLHLTQVDVGNETLQIVCGAPNVAKDQKVLVATPGTTLYPKDGKPFEIKKAKLRGVESNGMICAEDEIGIGTSHAGIMILDEKQEIGKNAADIFEIKTDYVFEIGLTPNRSDAMSHMGVARDIFAVVQQRFPGKKAMLKQPELAAFKADNNALPAEIIVENKEACIRYSGLTLNNIKVEESPRWLKNYLQAVGLRPINAVVDITQFVMLECGQPLHAFDYDKVKDGKVIIKNLPEGTPFKTLDEIDRKLSDQDLMICNNKEGMCIAGVFGGADSGVTMDTRKVFLESATFHPVSIRKTAKRHDLHTDASFRFERGVDAELTLYAAKRAAYLMKEICGAEFSSELLDVYPKKVEKNQIRINLNNIHNLIGLKITPLACESILKNLDFEILEQISEEDWIVAAPMNKVDVTREADVAEEILRIYGYNNIPMPEKANTVFSLQNENDAHTFREYISDLLSNKGLSETMNNSLANMEWHDKTGVFDSKTYVPVLNPLSRELNIMRPSMISGILQSLAYNINRKYSDLQFYEMGRVYTKLSDDKSKPVTKQYSEQETLAIAICGNTFPENWKNKEEKAGYYHLKSIVEYLFARTGTHKEIKITEEHSSIMSYGISFKWNDQTLAGLGMIKPAIAASSDVDIPVYYAEINLDLFRRIFGKMKTSFIDIPKFPEVRRDLSVLISRDIRFADIEETARKQDKKLLKAVNLFDVYTDEKMGSDKKSYALSFIFQSEEKTLTDKETDKSMDKISRALKEVFGAELR
ncbi:MAG: phenylalanine--tRNA ligase subunit beta [Marinilabiliales bacterium]|nr:MAG: phenylalanine--tRNA ligase subunit beta [Marinilabiliales bacterium]